MKKHLSFLLRTVAVFVFSIGAIIGEAQNDVMMQAFYWNVPVDADGLNGYWWDTLSGKADELKSAGFTGLWIPSPSKGNWGIGDMGYGIYDHYDLGNYDQKGTVETRFGSRAELEAMIEAFHDTSDNSPYVNVYADVVLNHVYSSDQNLEVNPVVKQYVFDEALKGGSQFVPYPTNEVNWVIPNAAPGEYYVKIKGYQLNWVDGFQKRAYSVRMNWTGVPNSNSYSWESEPNNGNGQSDLFPGSGQVIRGFITDYNDVDEYKVVVSSAHDLIITLEACEQDGADWSSALQQNGYYPFEIWHNGQNLAPSVLQAQTRTNLTYPAHTGAGEANLQWNYTHFHPADENDWLGGWGSSDEVITNTKGFGNDFNTFDPVVQNGLKDWGEWLASEIDFDGFRLDFVRGIQEEFVADWVNNLPLLSGHQRYIVGEYWGVDYRIRDWVNNVGSYGADVDGFDFPLKWSLRDLCNGDSNWDVRGLNNAGMVRNNQGKGLPGTSVVTFLDNHDTGKEHDKWVKKDWHLGYAYILTHEGRPCVFYPHYYGVTQHDNHSPEFTVTPPTALKEDINKLIFVRETYLGGTLEVLTEVGNPYPSSNLSDVYVARRQGNGAKDGAIVVINNGNSTKGVWIDATPSGFSNWKGQTLVNAFDGTQVSPVYADGRCFVEAPARGYAVYVLSSDLEDYNALKSKKIGAPLEDIFSGKASFGVKLFPNPAKVGSPVNVMVEGAEVVDVEVYNAFGKEVKTLKKVSSQGALKGLNASAFVNGTYVVRVSNGANVVTSKLVIVN